MFGMGAAEIGVIIVVALLVFGPDKLPDLAKQAGGFVRTLRRMADNAKDDFGREIGHDLKDVNLRDLDPREVVRRSMFDDSTKPSPVKETRILRPGEKPPFDSEAT
ncbi:MAG: sec-independent translocase [Aeromicrobium sp.]|uniref:sec-independent translocase n=1 Tax=Aeromicrobium sp. TaxID=1871063 RepID=UPI003C31426A